MRRFILLAVLLVVTVFAASALSETGQAGMAGAFLKMGVGARALGMGGAYCAVAEGVDAVFYNPAGPGMYPVRQVAFSYHSLTLDRNLNSVAIIYPVQNEAVLGFSWLHASVSDVPMIDSDRNYYDDFHNNNNALALSFSKLFSEQFSLGGSIRYIQSTLDVINSYAVGADLGVLYKPLPNYTLGFAALDLGSNMRWDSSNYWSGTRGSDYTDRFPYRFRGGVSGNFLDQTLVAAVDVMKVERLGLKLYTGAEYWITKKVTTFIEDEEAEDELVEVKNIKRILGVRAGYGDGSFSAGLSLYYPVSTYSGGFDYAFVAGKQSEGSSHIFTVRLMF
jgi:hypothetical protein